MEPRPYLRCLGQPALFSPAGEPVRFRTRKHLALLVYLAVEHRPVHRRDRLAELFWPAVTLREARHSLATALSVLRPRVGPGWLAADRDSVTLNPGALALDLERLLAGDILGTEVTGPLEVAAFLDGFDLPGTGEFGLWKDRQQARLLPAIKSALVVLIDRCRRTGDSRQIELLADRMLALDELSEEAIRAKMEARAFAGDRLTALKIFEEWKEKLAEELGAVPSELVEGMAVRLRRRGWERTTLSHIPPVPTDQWRGRPFIGRAAEYRVLYEAWEGMRTGVPGHALVLGDSGIGKTTLVGRLTTAAGLQGAAISRVQCYDLEREIPYATLGNLIHGLLDRPGVSATPPEALAELARTVPEVRRRFPSIPPPEESQGETARIRLTEAFHQMLLAVAEEHPVILVVDDLHLADDASLAVLHLVMRRSRGQPIMVVLIARPGELPQSPQAARLREAGEGLGVRELELPPLTEEEGRDLVKVWLRDDHPQPGPTARRTLIHAANGVPLVLELLLKDWLAHGTDSLAMGLSAMTAEYNRREEIYSTYRIILSRILTTLDPATRNVLNLAAILGHRLNDLAMYDLLGLTQGQRIAGLSHLTDLRVFRDSTAGLEFVNELMRAYAYASIPSSIRKALHGSVASRLLGANAADDSAGLEIAWHCTRAGRVAEATPYLLRGARHAVARGAPHEAERALASALPHLDAPERLEGVLLLAEVLQEQGCWQDSIDQIAKLQLDDPEAYREHAFVLEALARLNISPSSAEFTVRHVPELFAISRQSRRPSTRATAIRVVALLAERFRDQALAESLLHEIESNPIVDLDPQSEATFSLAKAMLLYETGQTAASRECVLRALEGIQKKNAAMVTVHLQAGLAALDSREGAYESAIKHLSDALAMAKRLGNDTVIASLTGNTAIALARLGRVEEQAAIRSSLPTTKSAELSGFFEIQITYAECLAHALGGRKHRVSEVISTLEARLAGSVPPWMRQAWALWKADVLWISGRREEALTVAEEAIGRPSVHLVSQAFAGPFARWLAMLGCKRGYDDVITVVNNFATTIDKYDAMDQAEIMCAKWLVESYTEGANSTTIKLVEAKLAKLPASVRTQLAALDVLPRC